MSGQASPVRTSKAPDPQPLFDVATGFMRAKHLFVAAELGIFEALANGGKPLGELARDLKLPPRTARIIVDVVTALGFLEREGDTYRNSEIAQGISAAAGHRTCVPSPGFGTG